MKILITGVNGYIGSLLAPLLARHGHDVTGLDTGFYLEGWLHAVPPQDENASPRTARKDVRRVEAADIAGADCVVHLAELSNDPLGELRPEVTTRINHLGSIHLARAAKRAGVSRFIYSSSCSVYGAGSDDAVNESAPTDPQTTYARCKVLVEQALSAMADDHFSPVILRNATAYGASPRMRFDIVLNNLAGLAHTTGRISMTSDGTPWRPLVHVLDICRAIACAAEAPSSSVHGQIFNVGHDDQNYRVRDIASIVGDAFTGSEVTIGSNGSDRRSYRVAFDKIHRQLPGFTCEWDARKGATQLRDLFARIDLDAERFGFRAFTRLEALKYLLRTRQVNDELFWQP